MSETKHTPGPWRVGDRKPYVEIWGPMRMNSHPILASMESEPREANARLMAAAPDMLAALKEIRELLMNPKRSASRAIEDALVPLDFAVNKATTGAP